MKMTGGIKVLGEDEILDYASTKKMAERMEFHRDAGYLAP
jgi:hypothetical protein